MPTQIVKNFMGYTTLHGLGRLGEAKYMLQKMFWSLVFVASMSMCSYQVYRLGTQYMSFQVNSKLTMQHEPQRFPGVSICNVNPLRYPGVILEPSLFQIIEKTAEFYSINLNDFYANGNLKNPNYTYETVYDPQDLDDIDPLLAARRAFIIRMDNLTTEKVFEMAQYFHEFVATCRFMGKECDQRNFTIYRDRNYGICYALKTDNLYADLPGIEKGLKITFNVQQMNYIPFVTEDVGIRIAIHDPQYSVDVGALGISLPTGFQVDIGLNTKIIERLPGPGKSCDESNRYPNILACTDKCTRTRIAKKCYCALTSQEVDEKNDISYCGVYDLRCIDEVKAAQDTDCSCKIPCREVSYEKTLSMTRWPAENQETVIKNSLAASMDYSNSKNDLLVMKIAFSSLITEKIVEEKAYTDENFVSDIGGQLGLWIGMSVLSMTEVLELMILLITHWCRKKKTEDSFELQ